MSDDHSEVAVLNITGHGGLGKSALMRRFDEIAREEGREVRALDGRDLATVDALHQALGGGELMSCVQALNSSAAVVLIDTLETAPGLARHLLDELLPRLDVAVKVVVATRRRLIHHGEDHPLAAVVREIRLNPFVPAEVCEYLLRRGVAPELLPVVMAASVGNPLAVSMAADLVTELADTDLRAVEDWREGVRGLTQRIMRDVEEPLRVLMEAAAVVRQFDEDLLAELSDAGTTQMRLLLRLSFVRPSERGMRLHDDVRRILADDLRARRPQRYAELRERALSHYRRQMRRASPAEREWLAGERLYLWEDDFIRNAFFPDAAEEDEIFLEFLDPAVPADVAAVRRLWRTFGDRVNPPQGGAPTDDLLATEADALIGMSGNRFLIARHRDGRVVGVGPELRIGADNIDDLPPVVRGVVDHYFSQVGGDLPAHAAGSPYRYLGPIVVDDSVAAAATSKLARWAFGSWIHGGTVFAASTLPGYAGLMEMLGFRRLDVDVEVRGRKVHPLVLELEADDVEAWIERITGVLAAMPGPPEPAAAAEGISVRLLGDFAVVREGEDVTPSGNAAAAVKHIAVAGGALHVDELVERLWPDAPPGRGRVRLRNVLRRVHEAAGPLLHRAGQRVQLSGEVVVDAQQFGATVDSARDGLGSDPRRAAELARSAIELYEGDLLPGDLYVDQFTGARERLRRQHLLAHDVLAEAALATGDRDEAVKVLDRAIELDRFDESRYVKASRVLHESGRTGQAIKVVRRARAAMAELGVKPSEELDQLDQTLHS